MVPILGPYTSGFFFFDRHLDGNIVALLLVLLGAVLLRYLVAFGYLVTGTMFLRNIVALGNIDVVA